MRKGSPGITPKEIRAAALREAAEVCRAQWKDERDLLARLGNRGQSEDRSWIEGFAEAALSLSNKILALIDKEPT